MAGMDAQNSGWVWNLLKHNLVAVLVPEIRGGKYGSGPEFRTLFSALLSSRLGPRHTMHLGTVLNYVNGLHVNKVTFRPSAHHDGSEVHPDVVVQGSMVRGSVVTERTVPWPCLERSSQAGSPAPMPSTLQVVPTSPIACQ